jgi:hypothetical protein
MVSGIQAQSSGGTTNRLTPQERITSDTPIILPEVELRIHDESEIPLQEHTAVSLGEESPLLVDLVDFDSLYTARMTERIILDLTDSRKELGFSLSTFQLFYGRYENLFLDITLGKSVNSLNYLVNYLRNKRSATGYNDETYFGTEFNVDDLGLDFIISLSERTSLNANVGYYDRRLGLYDSPYNIAESIVNFPIGFAFTFNVDKVSQLKAELGYKNLLMTHTLFTHEYRSQYLWELDGKFEWLAHWSKDNSLKAGVEYSYLSFEDADKHEGYIYAVNRLSIIPLLSLDVGGHVYVYSDKPVHFYPEVFLHFRFETLGNIKVGINGIKETFFIDNIIAENQIMFADTLPEEAWVYMVSMNITPVKILTLRLNASYNTYASLMGYAYNEARDLYMPFAHTNVNVFQTEVVLETSIAERFIAYISYKFRLPDKDDILFFTKNTATAGIEYTNPDWGFMGRTFLTYKDVYLALPENEYPSYVNWNIYLSKSISKEFFVEVRFNNILNMDIFEKPRVPFGGFGYYGGVKILL